MKTRTAYVTICLYRTFFILLHADCCLCRIGFYGSCCMLFGAVLGLFSDVSLWYLYVISICGKWLILKSLSLRMCMLSYWDSIRQHTCCSLCFFILWLTTIIFIMQLDNTVSGKWNSRCLLYQLSGQPEAVNIHPYLYSTYKVSQHNGSTTK